MQAPVVKDTSILKLTHIATSCGADVVVVHVWQHHQTSILKKKGSVPLTYVVIYANGVGVGNGPHG